MSQWHQMWSLPDLQVFPQVSLPMCSFWILLVYNRQKSTESPRPTMQRRYLLIARFRHLLGTCWGGAKLILQNSRKTFTLIVYIYIVLLLRLQGPKRLTLASYMPNPSRWSKMKPEIHSRESLCQTKLFHFAPPPKAGEGQNGKASKLAVSICISTLHKANLLYYTIC